MIRTMTSGKKNSLAKTIFVKISVKKEQKKMLGHLFKTQFTVKLIYFEDSLHTQMRSTNTN